ncbi:MAG: hypothetical protein JW850_23510 [Thermoflexales bacterium]|nr:hypothetical protein [Thermoflexales bacterium]
MSVHIIREPATAGQIDDMLQELDSYIKLAVDVERGILAGGGEYHADCEQALLDDGSRQESIWGADWYPVSRTIQFGALINIRPRQGNFQMDIGDPTLCEQIEAIVRRLLEGHTP